MCRLLTCAAAAFAVALVVLVMALTGGGSALFAGEQACAAPGAAPVDAGSPFADADEGDPTRGYPTGGAGSGRVMDGGEAGTWGGSMPRALDWATIAGLRLGSQKRTTVQTANGNVSDHYLGAALSYGVDLPTTVPAGDPIAERLGDAIGLSGYRGGRWESRALGGYRYQIGWRVPDHYDHIHIGVRRVGAADDDAPVVPAPSPTVPVAARAGSGPARGGADVDAIGAYLRGRGSPLATTAEYFVREGERTGIDPRFVVAIACHETVCGTYGPSQPIHNAFGLGPGMSFPSWEAGITYAFNNLAGNLYRGDGRVTIAAIGARWAPVGASNDPGSLNQHWVGTVGELLRQLGGDPSRPVMAATAQGGAEWVSVSAGASAECTPAALDSAAAGASAQAVVEWARGHLGLPYVWGANHGVALATMREGRPAIRAFDCSSLLSWAYAVGAGLYIGDVTYAQWGAGDGHDPNVTRGRDGAPPGGFRAGDLIFRRYSSPERPEHVLMAISATQLIHAPSTGDVVKIEAIPSDLSGYGWVRYAQLGSGGVESGTGGDGDA